MPSSVTQNTRKSATKFPSKFPRPSKFPSAFKFPEKSASTPSKKFLSKSAPMCPEMSARM